VRILPPLRHYINRVGLVQIAVPIPGVSFHHDQDYQKAQTYPGSTPCPERAEANNSPGLHFWTIITSLIVYLDLTLTLFCIHIGIALTSLVRRVRIALIDAQTSLLSHVSHKTPPTEISTSISFLDQTPSLVFFVS
jgi:hypothetical protein